MALDQVIASWNAAGAWVASFATLGAIWWAYRSVHRNEAFQRGHEQARNAAALYMHFASAEMERARGDAYAFLVENNASKAPLSYQEIHTCSSATLTSVTRVLQFWEVTSQFQASKYVDEHLTRSFLRHYFNSHCQGYFFDLINVSRAKTTDANFLEWIKAVEHLIEKWDVRPAVQVVLEEVEPRDGITAPKVAAAF